MRSFLDKVSFFFHPWTQKFLAVATCSICASATLFSTQHRQQELEQLFVYDEMERDGGAVGAHQVTRDTAEESALDVL